MRKTSLVIGAGAAVIISIVTCPAASAADQGTAKPVTSGSTKPHLGNGPAVEKSVPSSAPAATRTENTGATDQNKTVKAMNSNGKAKVETEGK